MGTEGKRIPQVLPKPTKPYPIFTNRTNIPTEPPLPPRLPPSPPIITFITHSPSRPPYGLPHYPILASPVASPGPRNSSEVGRLPRPRSAQRSKLIRTARPRVVRRPPECNSSRDFGIRFSSLVGFGKSSFFFSFSVCSSRLGTLPWRLLRQDCVSVFWVRGFVCCFVRLVSMVTRG